MNPVVNDIYTLRPDEENKTQLIVDSETDYDRDGVFKSEREMRTPIGEVLEMRSPVFDAALHGTGHLDNTPYTDRWGTWITAFWPLRDSSGKVEAVLGVDFAANQWTSEIRAARAGAIAIIAITLLMLFSACTLYVLQKIELMVRKDAADAMRVARDAAQSANTLKSQFLACMSHEIRTPMNGVMGTTELLLATPLDQKQQHLGELIFRSASNLLGVINDILEYSKIEADKLLLENVEFDPREVIADVGELLGSAAREKGLRFVMQTNLDRPQRVCGDALRLRQVLTNLVGNAIKFTAVGEVTVSACWQTNDPNELALRCEVRDTGLGMDDATQANLFNPFIQADSSITRRFGGTGLGLAISKRLVDLMGGQIGCYSELGSGTTFWFVVPMIRAVGAVALSTSAAQLPGALTQSSTRKDTVQAAQQQLQFSGHVLLAEDNPVNQLIAHEMLGSLGFTVHAVSDGRAAVAAVRSRDVRYDAIVMDCEMPALDGRSATRQIREFESTLPEHEHVPIIALTAHAALSDRDACLAAGMDDYLSKPVTGRELATTLARHYRPKAA